MERLGGISTGRVRPGLLLLMSRLTALTLGSGKNVSPRQEPIRGGLKYSWAEGSS
jgi:hypothetical protein